MAIYFYLHVLTVTFPLLRSFEKRITYYRKWKSLFPAIAITAIFFLLWDILFTEMGVWGFNPNYLLGVYFFNLPLEELLFFITVPFASVFIYECVLYFIKEEVFGGKSKFFVIGLSILLIALAIANNDRAYTFWNFLFTGIFILVSQVFFGIKNIDRFSLAYLFHLIPFFMVNGILTGSFLEEPIVWYNNQENLGIRLFTIPIEDTIYALLLLYMNVNLYEGFKRIFMK